MLSVSVGGMRKSYLETPGRGGVGQAAPFKDFRPPSPSGGRALCASFVGMSVPVRAALHPQPAPPPATSALMLVSEGRGCSRAQSAAPWDRHHDSKGSGSPGASVLLEQSAALIATLGVGPEPKVVCRSKSATPPSSPFLQGRF